uniref:hypothetical protein n=1 Tax=Comamonas testosteroni TaxID=285 RepID=UPI0015FD52B1|nr:hypothetical protein [Comamonas testosteroni]
MRKILVGLAIAGVIVVGVFGWRSYLVHELRKPVLAELSDPESAKFRNEWLLFGWNEWTVKGNILCGEVNAKNRMGGYVGYVAFKATAGLLADIGVDDFELKRIDDACKR